MPETETLERDLGIIKEKYDYCEAHTGNTLELFRGIFDYVDHIESSRILKEVIKNKIDLEHEFGEKVRVKYPLSHATFDITDYADFDSEEYILWKYDTLLEFYNTFKRIKDMRSEQEMRNAKIVIEQRVREYNYTDSKIIDTGNLWRWEEASPGIHLKQLKIFHDALIYAINGFLSGVLTAPRNRIHYDETKGVLHFMGKEIKIMLQKKPSQEHYLLGLLFKNNPFEELDYADIATDEFFEGRSLSAVIKTCERINDKVKEATSDIADFLDYTTSSAMWVRVNPKYRQ